MCIEKLYLCLPSLGDLKGVHCHTSDDTGESVIMIGKRDNIDKDMLISSSTESSMRHCTLIRKMKYMLYLYSSSTTRW